MLFIQTSERPISIKAIRRDAVAMATRYKDQMISESLSDTHTHTHTHTHTLITIILSGRIYSSLQSL